MTDQDIQDFKLGGEKFSKEMREDLAKMDADLDRLAALEKQSAEIVRRTGEALEPEISAIDAEYLGILRSMNRFFCSQPGCAGLTESDEEEYCQSHTRYLHTQVERPDEFGGNVRVN